MTREEKQKAIDVLKKSVPVMAMTQEEFNDYIQTLNKIMDWLEKDPCGDAISRQNLLKGLANIAKAKARSDAQKALMGRVMFFTEKLPSVTSQPEMGRWSRKTKVDAYDIAGIKTWGIKCQCDRCCFTTIVVEDFGYYKYCPHCGAKMAESEVSDANID